PVPRPAVRGHPPTRPPGAPGAAPMNRLLPLRGPDASPTASQPPAPGRRSATRPPWPNPVRRRAIPAAPPPCVTGARTRELSSPSPGHDDVTAPHRAGTHRNAPNAAPFQPESPEHFRNSLQKRTLYRNPPRLAAYLHEHPSESIPLAGFSGRAAGPPNRADNVESSVDR